MLYTQTHIYIICIKCLISNLNYNDITKECICIEDTVNELANDNSEYPHQIHPVA